MVTASMDHVQLCVTVAIELDKENWSRDLRKCEHVDEDLICQRLQQIHNAEFKTTMVDMFREHVNRVKQHLQKHSAAFQLQESEQP
jgi:hypothetical protein